MFRPNAVSSRLKLSFAWTLAALAATTMTACGASAPAQATTHSEVSEPAVVDEAPMLVGGGTQSCHPQEANVGGDCDQWFGYHWDGMRCRSSSGCGCEGQDCDAAYETIEECREAHSECFTNDPEG